MTIVTVTGSSVNLPSGPSSKNGELHFSNIYNTHLVILCTVHYTVRVWDSIVTVATHYGAGRLGVRSPLGTRNFLFFTRAQISPGPTQAPVQWVTCSFLRGKVAGAWN